MELAQVTNVVHDLDRAVKFHRDTLGLPLLFQAPPSLAFFQIGVGAAYAVAPETAEQDHPGSVLYLKVKGHRGGAPLARGGAASNSKARRIACMKRPTTTYGWRSFTTPTRIRWRSWRRSQSGRLPERRHHPRRCDENVRHDDGERVDHHAVQRPQARGDSLHPP